MNIGIFCNFCYLKTNSIHHCEINCTNNNMPIHTIRPNYVVVDNLLSPIKHKSSHIDTLSNSSQKRIRRKRQNRRIKANEKKKLLRQKSMQYNNTSRLNQINQAITGNQQSSSSEYTSDDDEINITQQSINNDNIHVVETQPGIDMSDMNTDMDMDDSSSHPSSSRFTWLVPSTTILTNTTQAITNTTKSILTSIMQPWLKTNELQSTVQKLQDEMNELKSQIAQSQQSLNNTNIPLPPPLNSNSAPNAPPLAPPIAPAAPPMAPSMCMPPPPPPPPVSFLAPSSTRGHMLANIANAKLKKITNMTDNDKSSKQATLADISASDLLSAANRLRKASDTPMSSRVTRSGSQATIGDINLADIMSVKLRSTPARNTRQSISGGDKDGPIVSLLDLQSIKLKKSTIDKSPGGTPRMQKRNNMNNNDSNKSDESADTFLFQQLTKKFKSDPRSQLYQSTHNVTLDTPWTTQLHKTNARMSKSPIHTNNKSPRQSVKSPHTVLSDVTNTTVDNSTTRRRQSNKSPVSSTNGTAKSVSRRASTNNTEPPMLLA